MAKFFRRMVVSAALAVPLMVGGVNGTAAAAPTTVLPIPVVAGPEIGRMSKLFTTITVAATVEQPGIVTFDVPALVPHHYAYYGRWITVQWHNLRTDATGSVDLRYWQQADPSLPDNFPDEYSKKLPASASAATDTGPIVVTVAHKQGNIYQRPPMSNALVPGAGVVFA
ncbi:hypothetical protein [Nocardia paucivorans]|uniref:hypothetical protein n=1 Tax=Nocardia paucivorans TaxID=114259 RepID=UPI000307E107|nr:hypothetical protein [Nocardia paucivorans]